MIDKLTSKFTRVFDRILTGGAVFSGFLLIFIMVAVFCDITLRKALNMPLLWVQETTTFSLVAIAFFSAAWLLKREGHVSMDQLFKRQSPKTQAMLTTITSIISLICCLIVVWYGAQVTVDYYQNGDRYYSTLEAYKWPIAAVVVLGFFLLVVQFLRRINGSLTTWRRLTGKGQESPTEVDT